VEWDPVDGATAYSVYRAKVNGSGGVDEKILISVVDEPFYIDRDVIEAGDYRYFIATIDELRCEGRQSRAIEVSTEPGSDSQIALMVDELDGPPALRNDPSADQVPPSAPAELRTALTGVWPTPAIDRTAVSFTLSDDGARGGATARLNVYDVTGRLVRRLVDTPLGPGEHTREWDLTSDAGRNVASGCYMLVLECGGDRTTTKALVLR